METNRMKLDGRMIVNFDFDAFYAWARKNDITLCEITDELGYNHSYFSNARTINRLRLAAYKNIMTIYKDIIKEDFLIHETEPEAPKPKKPETIFDEFGKVVTRKGHIYKVIDKRYPNDPPHLYLALSSDEMGSNKYILGTFLRDNYNDAYDDVFRLSNKWCISVDRLTYLDRFRFTEDVAYLPDDILDAIDDALAKRLGL